MRLIPGQAFLEDIPMEHDGMSFPALEISYTGNPTGGSVTFATIDTLGVTANIVVPFNATASEVARLFTVAYPNLNRNRGQLAAFGQQGLPQHVCLIFLTDYAIRITGTTVSLTGGTSPNVTVRTTFHEKKGAFRPPLILFSGSGAASATGGTPTVTTDVDGGFSSTRKCLKLEQNAGGSMLAEFNIPAGLDLTQSKIEVDIFVDSPTPVNIGLSVHSGSPVYNVYNVQGGVWTTISTDLSRRTGTQQSNNASAATKAVVRMGSIGGEQTADITNGIVYISEVRIRTGEPSRLSLIFDDATVDHATYLGQIADSFPDLEFGMGVISSLVGTPGYASLLQLQALNTRKNITLYCHTLDHGDRQSGSTQNYETGIDPLGSGEDTNEFVFGWKPGAWPGAGTTVYLTFANGDTIPFNYNATLKAVGDAIRARVAGAIITTEGWNSSQIGSGMNVRVKMPASQPLPTISNTTNWIIGWAYSVAEITRQYVECSQYLLENGLSKNGSHLVAISPLGSFGRAHIQALKNAGMTTCFQAFHVANEITSSSKSFLSCPYGRPRVDGNSADLLCTALGSLIALDGYLVIMLHVIGTSPTTTSPAQINIVDLYALCANLNRLLGRAFVSTTVMEELQTAGRQYGALPRKDVGSL